MFLVLCGVTLVGYVIHGIIKHQEAWTKAKSEFMVRPEAPGEVVFVDNFSTDKGYWKLGRDDSDVSYLSGGKLFLKNRYSESWYLPNRYMKSFPDDYLFSPFGRFSSYRFLNEFIVETEITRVKYHGLSDEIDYVGVLIWPSKSNRFIGFFIYYDKYYKITEYRREEGQGVNTGFGSSWFGIFAKKKHELLPNNYRFIPSSISPNRNRKLRIVFMRRKIMVYLNEIFLVSHENPLKSENNFAIGFIAGNGVEAGFDNLRIYSIAKTESERKEKTDNRYCARENC